MGVDTGFSFYKKVSKYELNGKNYVKLEPAKVIKDDNGEMSNILFVCGRCQATSYFIDFVKKYEDKCGDKEYSSIVLNDESLNGFIVERSQKDIQEFGDVHERLFYRPLNELYNYLDFDEAEKTHQRYIDETKELIEDIRKEIADLRRYQSDAKTEVAFNGFQEEIDKAKEDIENEKSNLKYLQEEDYDYIHYEWIKENIEQVEKIMEENPDIIVTAWGG